MLFSNDTCKTYEQLKCIFELDQIFVKFKDKCSCPFECNSVILYFGTSTADFPASSYGNKLLKETFISEKHPNMTLDELKNRALGLRIYYPILSYAYVSQEPQYTITDLISSIGGSLGLLIGMSMLSIMEVIELVIKSVFICFEGGNSYIV